MERKAYKAVAALLATEAGTVGTAMLDGHLTLAELVAATGSALVAAYAVWRTPNPPKTPGGGVSVFTGGPND